MKIKYKLAMLPSFAFLLLGGCTKDRPCVVQCVSNDKILTKDLDGKEKIFVLERNAELYKYMRYIGYGDTLYFWSLGSKSLYNDHDVIYVGTGDSWLRVSDAKKRQIEQAKKQHEFDSLFAIMHKEQQDGLGR